MPTSPADAPRAVKPLDEVQAWALLCWLARTDGGTSARLSRDGAPEACGPDDPARVTAPGPSGVATLAAAATGEARTLFDRYAPLCTGARRPRVLAHLGQTVDGRIATEGGASQFITGPENLDHVHRLRALFDVVLVGADTVDRDDPRLTTRRVPGPSPTRVCLDRRRRLPDERRVFRDGAAPTLVVCGERAAAPTAPDVVAVPETRAGRLDLAAVLDALAARGLRRVFVEGGGVTVSRFLEAGLVDRLQIAVAPMIVGSGRPALALPPIEDLDQALRPPCRVVPMGEDVLFDFDLRNPA